VGTKLQAMVRGKAVPMEVVALPFLAPRYFRS
jgi:aminomethyltransferase